MILSVCMSPSIDVTMELDSLNVGKTNVVKNKEITLGGKGLNVAVGVARLGCDSYMTGLMYNENGYVFENALMKEGVGYSFVWNKGRVRENYKFIDSRSMLTEINDVGGAVTPEKAEEALAHIRMKSAKSDVTVLTGGLPRGFEDNFYAKMTQAVSPNSLKIIDTQGARLFHALDCGVDMIKPNLEELENSLGREMQDKQDMLDACYELIDRGARYVLLSLGKQGAMITDGSKSFYCKSLNVAMNSTVGAGDGMVAAAAVRLAEGAPISEILRAGVAAGTATVMTTGTVSFTKEHYNELLGNLRVTEL